MYSVVVGNVGTVHKGNDLGAAQADFDCFADRSYLGIGRAAGEDVTLFEDGEILLSYESQWDQED